MFRHHYEGPTLSLCLRLKKISAARSEHVSQVATLFPNPNKDGGQLLDRKWSRSLGKIFIVIMQQTQFFFFYPDAQRNGCLLNVTTRFTLRIVI